ncbi:hypothetical protein OUZ56_014142 [Daphnia magna]|uniref:Uncharacterized protein n=1 Tax=Daphnia magna TaxID=35525 RepID=A0ABQ9Z7Y7_9CRUS|nr:hypothetical protein OUZ56_014142 [Daphnia magna]
MDKNKCPYTTSGTNEIFFYLLDDRELTWKPDWKFRAYIFTNSSAAAAHMHICARSKLLVRIAERTTQPPCHCIVAQCSPL